MNWKDRISIGISVLALSISAIGSYFTFFRVTPGLEAAVLGIAVGQDEMTAKVAVMNTGNRQVAIIDAEMFLVQMDNGDVLRQPIDTDKMSSDSEAFPILIEPGKLALLTVKRKLNWDTVVAYRQEVEPGDDHSHKTVAGIKVRGLASTGESLFGTIDAITIQLRDKSFGGYSLDSAATPFTILQKQPRRR